MTAVPIPPLAAYPELVAVQPVITLPADGMFTWDDLQAIPDEAHHHYEIIEGQILMSPSPGIRHQRAVLRLCGALIAAASDNFEVIVSPFDFAPVETTVVQPNVLVIAAGSDEDKKVVESPALVIEVLSPTGRTQDRVLKRAIYQQHGVPSYWIVDPDVPSVVVLELDEDGVYQEVASATGSDRVTVQRPFPVTVVPADLG